mgnify:CR=1 FL=1
MSLLSIVSKLCERWRTVRTAEDCLSIMLLISWSRTGELAIYSQFSNKFDHDWLKLCYKDLDKSFESRNFRFVNSFLFPYSLSCVILWLCLGFIWFVWNCSTVDLANAGEHVMCMVTMVCKFKRGRQRAPKAIGRFTQDFYGNVLTNQRAE